MRMGKCLGCRVYLAIFIGLFYLSLPNLSQSQYNPCAVRPRTHVQPKIHVPQTHAQRGTRVLPKTPVRLTLVAVDGAAVPAPKRSRREAKC